jgi:hypothetical protein
VHAVHAAGAQVHGSEKFVLYVPNETTAEALWKTAVWLGYHFQALKRLLHLTSLVAWSSVKQYVLGECFFNFVIKREKQLLFNDFFLHEHWFLYRATSHDQIVTNPICVSPVAPIEIIHLEVE